MHRWAAEVAVEEELVRRLVAGQFPELELRSLRLLDEGWDNAVWVVDERWAFRFPRRELGASLGERELAVLPLVAPLLPLPVPLPRFLGRPAEGYPWPFWGAALLPGREGSEAGDRAPLARPLGEFLRVLHSLEIDVELPFDPSGRADPARRVPHAREALADLERLGLWRVPAPAERVLGEALLLPPATEAVLAHGDLHFRHLLVEEDRLTGVIDWGDVCRAPRSLDLQVVWSFFPPGARAAFLDAYGPVDEDTLLRARMLAISLCAVLAAYGHHEGMPSVEREAIAGLERAARP